MSLFTDSGTEDEELELDNPVETSRPVTIKDELEENGTPEPCRESFLDRAAVDGETKCEDQGGTALERALGQLKRAGWTGTIESFGLAQAKLLTKKCYKTKREKTPEERERQISKKREQAKKRHEAKMKNETPEEREKRLEKMKSQGKRAGWTGTIESFGLAQARLLTKKCYRTKHEETVEERERRVSKKREQAKKRHEAKMKNETPEEREKRLEKIKNWRISRESKRSEAEKKKKLEKVRNRMALRRANETREEREKRNAFFREYQQKRYAEGLRPRKQLSETERAIMLEKRKMLYYLKAASETPEEREKRLAKSRASAKSKPKRNMSPETLEKINARRRELYRRKKLLKPPPAIQENWDIKIEAVESSVLEEPTNHSLHSEVTVEPDNLQEPLLIYVKKEI